MLSSLVREFNFGMIYSAGRFSSRPPICFSYTISNVIACPSELEAQFFGTSQLLRERYTLWRTRAQRVVSCLWRVLRIVEGAKSTNGIGGYKYPTYNVERIRFHFGEDGSLGHAKLHMTS
jgi:hypothetical protein